MAIRRRQLTKAENSPSQNARQEPTYQDRQNPFDSWGGPFRDWLIFRILYFPLRKSEVDTMFK